MSGVDKAGALAGTLCAVHCLLVAFMPWILVGLGLKFLISGAAEWASTGLAIVLAGLALVGGFRKHRSPKVAALFAAGVCALLLSRFMEEGSGHHHHDHHETEQGHEQTEGHHHSNQGSESQHSESEHGLDFHTIASLIGISGGLLIASAHIQNIRYVRDIEGY